MSDCLNLLLLFSCDFDSKRNFCEGGTCLQAKNGLLEIDQMACFESPLSICRFIQNVSNESYFFFVPKFTMSVQVCFLTGWTFFSMLYYYSSY